MAWKSVRVNDFEGFVSELRSMLPQKAEDRTRYWFRGQSNAAWDLEPSFLRGWSEGDLPLKAALGLEEEALKAFQFKAHLFVSPHLLEKVKTKPCWWPLMQHHVAPTRLLDGTPSPSVAAYFAAQQQGGAKEDGAVWCFCSGTLRNSFVENQGRIPDFESPEAPHRYDSKLKELSEEQLVIPLTFAYASS